MEIERKFLISQENLPQNLVSYPSKKKSNRDIYPQILLSVSADPMILIILPINPKD